MPESKRCLECGASFIRPAHRSNQQWAQMQCCSTRCANTIRARGRPKRAGDLSRSQGKRAYQAAWQQRQAMPRWAEWWENHRRTQDLADLATPNIVYGRGAQPVSRRPKPRRFSGGYCLACGTGWIDYTARRPSGYCNRCQDRRWAADSRHKRRAWKANSAIIDIISPEIVFKRDRHRCQICGHKTRGVHPHPRSPTIDHIIPLAQGGDHSYLNVQTACSECNTQKGDRAANDQLRLLA